MRVMVFDVPAETGGALTILKHYHDASVRDKDSEWFFVVSTPQLTEHENVKVLNYPWVKKSWFHRLYFDNFVAHKLVEKYNVDEVLSLQNVIVPKLNRTKQILYLHQPLPFVEKRYGVTENFKFWVYQNIISKMIFKSIREADEVIVQTKWIMSSAAEKANVQKEKFVLKQPELNITVNKIYEEDEKLSTLFFYPASALSYKNHEVIVQACITLKNINNYRFIFTLKGDENKNIKKLHDYVVKENIPIDFIGSIDIEDVYEYYSKSILVFPSYIETFGLPMLEARMHQTPIFASDCAFSHEILDGYENVKYFDPFNSSQLSDLIKNALDSK